MDETTRKMLERPKLSSLQARMRPEDETSEVWASKRAKLEKRKEHFVTVTAVNNFAKFISLSAPSVESVESNHATTTRKLASIMADCEDMENQIRSNADD